MTESWGEGEIDVTVVVPTRDRRPLLERKLGALASERAQGAFDTRFEVVVVADACRDDTEAFLAAYRPPYPLRWLRGPGLHAATARNLGAAEGRGEVLLFSDDDVVAPPGWVAENRRLHEATGFVGLSRQRLPPHLAQGDALDRVAGWWNTNGRSTSLRRSLFEALGGYDPAFSTYGGEDPDLGWRLRRAGARFRLLPQHVVEHWDEGYGRHLEAKARSAGQAHVAVWRKHGDARIAWALGVHPWSLAIKRALLAGPAGRALPSDRRAWELAYAEGAAAALAEVER
ncbi:MAG: glycosyltransferase family 2 protein [Trueperaceae bacterium]